uniref:N-alpha-acetyltransferase 60 n=1 Tax=Parastrongyloides trichosuri TaxID=131310 RepID=A0A0N4ZIE3_PARTI
MSGRLIQNTQSHWDNLQSENLKKIKISDILTTINNTNYSSEEKDLIKKSNILDQNYSTTNVSSTPNNTNYSFPLDSSSLSSVVVDLKSNKQMKKSTSKCCDLNQQSNLNNDIWEIRHLSKDNLYAVKAICEESFPVQYPDTWYEEVVNGGFISFGYFCNNVLTSLMICEIKQIKEYEADDRRLLSDYNGYALYILSLAVKAEHRRKGIAGNLLKYLLSDILKKNTHVGVVFLHAVTHNYGAIKFYKKSGFKLHTTLRNYYLIDGMYYDGYTFAYYVNGYKDPRWCLELMQMLTAWFFFKMKLIIVLFLLSITSIHGLGLGRKQSTGVKGKLVCDGKPAGGILVKLYDDDRGIDSDDLMAKGKTDGSGYFELSGRIFHCTIDPKINIYHDCNDGFMPCQRKFSIFVPDDYVFSGEHPTKYYDMGTYELSGKLKGEERDCIHKF